MTVSSVYGEGSTFTLEIPAISLAPTWSQSQGGTPALPGQRG